MNLCRQKPKPLSPWQLKGPLSKQIVKCIIPLRGCCLQSAVARTPVSQKLKFCSVSSCVKLRFELLVENLTFDEIVDVVETLLVQI